MSDKPSRPDPGVEAARDRIREAAEEGNPVARKMLRGVERDQRRERDRK